MNTYHRDVNKNVISDRFLRAAQDSYKAYLVHGPRSNKKLKILHGWLIDEIKNVLGGNYIISGLTVDSSSEKSVQGMYYKKKVDLSVSRDNRHLGVIGVKFIQSNYNQNKNNYFEQQLGETANLRSNDIAFGQLIVFTEPIPYNKEDQSTPKLEHVSDDVIERYSKLATDHQHPHVPDVQALCVVLLSQDRKRVLRICNRDDLPKISDSSYKLLEGKLSIENFINLFCQSVQLRYAKKNV